MQITFGVEAVFLLELHTFIIHGKLLLETIPTLNKAHFFHFSFFSSDMITRYCNISTILMKDTIIPQPFDLNSFLGCYF